MFKKFPFREMLAEFYCARVKPTGQSFFFTILGFKCFSMHKFYDGNGPHV